LKRGMAMVDCPQVGSLSCEMSWLKRSGNLGERKNSAT
jgi:hypothetical protein